MCIFLRNKVIEFEDIFADMLVKYCLPVLCYGIDSAFYILTRKI